MNSLPQINLHPQHGKRNSSGNASAEFSSGKLKKLILSVDDEPGLLYTREKILESEGYKVRSAADGESALQIFAAHPIDLVLLDYSMPGMNGGAVARQMKARRPRAPIMIVSANQQLPKAALACADFFLDKGQGPALLLQRIRTLFAMQHAK